MDQDGENVWKNTEFANSINQMLANHDSYLRLIRENSELRYEKYISLIEAGFSPEQALTILINTPIMG